MEQPFSNLAPFHTEQEVVHKKNHVQCRHDVLVHFGIFGGATLGLQAGSVGQIVGVWICML
eukprot:305635-Amphidinium_carterae.1